MTTSKIIFIYFLAVFLVLISILSIPNLFASKKKEPTGFFKKLLLYQGWFGLGACILGVTGFILFALEIKVLWFTSILCCAGLAFLGFLLSHNLIHKYFFSEKTNEGEEKDEADDKKEEHRKTLASIMPMQGKIALIGLLLGILCVMAAMMYVE